METTSYNKKNKNTTTSFTLTTKNSISIDTSIYIANISDTSQRSHMLFSLSRPTFSFDEHHRRQLFIDHIDELLS